MKRERVVVICPGRGSFNREELGYLKKYSSTFAPQLKQLDSWRKELGEPTISDLDGAASFSAGLHTPGENASILIHACAMADFQAIDRDRFDIVAVTGNSMGWYLALAAAGAADERSAFAIVNTMGSMMKGGVVGGQLIYPLTDENWHIDPKKVKLVDDALHAVNSRGVGSVYHSIRLGGFAVVGGDENGLRKLLKDLPPVDERYPMRLINHAAFHTPVLESVSAKAFEVLGADLFGRPQIPMIDGRGHIWQPYATDLAKLREYTLGHQVCRTYDFTQAVTVALKEFAPDRLILLGPGSTLGGSIGQILIKNRWKDISSKSIFSETQEKEPFLLAMGRKEQWAKVVAKNFL
jgi:[acyl-carrier-protein] S-malonyltransferase